MPYLVAADLPTAPAGERFRAALNNGGILQLPGAHNGMSAIQAKRAGFHALYLSGAAMTASMGLPDLGIITVDEVCFFIRQLARASGLPVLADGDTGSGEALNVMHMVRAFEDAGAGAVHIEDQLLPKKCGHLNDKKLADPHDMAAKVAAAPVKRGRPRALRPKVASAEVISGSRRVQSARISTTFLAAKASCTSRVRFDVSTTTGAVAARMVPYSGMVSWKSASTSNRNASNGSSARSSSSISSTAGGWSGSMADSSGRDCRKLRA